MILHFPAKRQTELIYYDSNNSIKFIHTGPIKKYTDSSPDIVLVPASWKAGAWTSVRPVFWCINASYGLGEAHDTR